MACNNDYKIKRCEMVSYFGGQD